jgi:hypothetical protein
MVALGLLGLFVLAGCGTRHEAAAPVVRPVAVPAYPSAGHVRHSANSTSATTDWTLPAGTSSERVYDWYVSRLPHAGWRIVDRNETGLRATRRGRSISVGVRGRTLEVIAS